MHCEFRTAAADQVVDELFAFLMTDAAGNESIPAIRLGNVAMPLVGADMERMSSFRGQVEQIAKKMNQVVRLCKFSQKEIIAEFKP